MCGRTSCCLCREAYVKATSYFDDTKEKYVLPNWYDGNNIALEFCPSTNIAPTDVTPVLISGAHLDGPQTKMVLQPMVWGLIPRWHKGQYKNHGLSTNNCRIEGMKSSKLYGPPLRKGNRCIILCEGFYEWQTTKGKIKQPYFIYSPQIKSLKVEDRMSWLEAEWNETQGWQGPRLLYMAGIYDAWEDEHGEIFHSYSVITMDSNETLSWLHHRMPAVLSTPEQIEGWLDYEGLGVNEAVSLLSPVKALSWHPVSSAVNNSRNKDDNCNKPIKLGKPSASSSFMSNWLKRGPAKVKQEFEVKEEHESPNSSSNQNKKIKTEL